MVARLHENWLSLVLAILCALALALAGVAAQPRAAWAGEGLANCGFNLSTAIGGGTYTLSIEKINPSGDGVMFNWDGDTEEMRPWHTQREDIEAISLGEGVTSIGNYAFAGCTNLESITIPASVTTIGESAFAGCANLKSVTVENPSVTVGEDAFYCCREDLVITGYAVKGAGEDSLPRYCNINNTYFNALNGDLGTYTLDLMGKDAYFDTTIADEEQEFWRVYATIDALARDSHLIDWDGAGGYDLDLDSDLDLDQLVKNRDGHTCNTFSVATTNSVKGSKTITIPEGEGRYYVAMSNYDGFYYSAITFKMTTIPLSDCTVGGIAAQTYTGKALTPGVSVKHGSKTLKAGTDYTVKYSGNTNAGTGKITLTGKGDYAGSVSKAFTINKASPSISLAAQTATYTGKAIAYSGKVTKKGSSGNVTYSYYSDAACKKAVKAANVKNVGTYYVKATLAADANHNAATSKAVKLTIAKAKATAKAKKATVSLKVSALKKKAQTVANLTVTCDKGKASYKNASSNKTAKKFKVNAKTGKVTVPKGTKKGTYAVKVKVTVNAGANYQKLTKTVSFKVKVK